jgi:NAD(P)-dependent dehydrogenase (short-subunit alcohol dehydrogenase family)
MPEEKSRAVIDINVRGVISGLYACFPLLKATPGATVVNTGSTAGMYGVADLAVYAASKHAVRGLTEALDIEWSRHGIHVCDLMPWLIDTPILDNIGSDSNRSLRDRATAGRQPIYPVTDVAEEVWRAVERRDRLHRPVGKMAHRTKFFAWHMPDALRKRMAQQRDA